MKLGLLTADSIHPDLVGTYGEYIDMFGRLIAPVSPETQLINYNIHLGEYPEDLDEVEGYLISGSSASVYEDKAWIRRLGEFVKILVQRKKPTVGICFGHQLVAHVLGGKTEKASVGWNIGTHTHSLNEEGEQLVGDHDGFQLLFSHQDQVVKPADGSITLASLGNCPIAMSRIGDHLLTIQGHPEFEKGYARDLIKMRREIFEEDLYQSGLDSLNQPNDRTTVAGWMIQFIQHKLAQA